jgi:hypothetical protein
VSLRRIVVDMITERGCGTVDHLMPRLESLGFTRQQASKALDNARQRGLLWCEKVRRSGMGRSTAKPSVYWPGTRSLDPMYDQLVKKKQPAELFFVPWVFDLGDPKPESAMPKLTGTTYTPLGPWISKELEEA